MKQTVYVIFQDHEDKFRPDLEWDADYYHEYVNVFGTANEARGVIQDTVLAAYYEEVARADAEAMIAEYVWDDYSMFEDVNFEVIEDSDQKIVFDSRGNINTLYFEEIEITV